MHNICVNTFNQYIKYFFFFSGIKVIFRVALVLFKIVFGDAGNFKDCPTLYETLEKLRHIPIQHLDEEMIVQDVSAFYVYTFVGTDLIIRLKLRFLVNQQVIRFSLHVGIL